MESVILGKVNHNGKGVHGWYRKVNSVVGIKIYEEADADTAMLEYLLTRYAERSSVMTTKALAFGTAEVGIKKAFDNSRKDLPVMNRPVMWMEHIEGKTMEYHIEALIKKAPLTVRGYDDRFDWAMAQESIQPILKQYNHSIEALQAIGMNMEDHDENFNNFIVDTSGLLHVIDFSFESNFIDPAFMDMVTVEMAPFLALRMPGEPYYNQLRVEGIIQD